MSIIDVHSHVWRYPDHFTDDFRRQARRARAGIEVDLTVRFEDYQRLSVPDVKTIVFGGKARLSGVWVDDRFVADYVAGAVFQVDPKSGEVTRTYKGGWLKNPNGVAVVSGQGPPSGSSFKVEDGVYIWKLAAADLARYSTPLDLAGFMNELVARAGQPQVKDLVVLLQANDGFWWKKIEGLKATGATVQGKPDASGTFQILSVSQG